MENNSINTELSNIKKINNIYANKEKKSLTEILTEFQYMSNDFSKLNDKIEKNKISYSNSRFDLCTLDEQRLFVKKQLQLIETLVTDKIYYTEGVVWNWYDIYALMHNKDYAMVNKNERKVIFSTADTHRPIGDQAYNMWNGLQIIDMDIKNEDLSRELKTILFDELNKYPWFLGVSFSSSKKSLHVWTKIRPISPTLAQRRIEFRCNFRHKYSYIYLILLKYMDKFGYKKEDIISYLDNAMAKPQQGIFIAYDHPFINTNFINERLDVTFESAINTGIESIDWITHPDLKQIFAKLEWFDNDNKENQVNIKRDDIENIDYRNTSKDKGKIHYKHNQRWQLANTLVYIYGEDKAFNIMCEICEGTSRRELKGDVHTAAIHNKPISVWAIKELNNNHGFNFKVPQSGEQLKETLEKVEEAKPVDVKNLGVNPIGVISNNTKVINLYINKNQYLSDIKDDILKNLSKITLLEAGAGYGKTEMIKAFKSRVLLILPFTSIIKSKIELDEKTEDWLYYYGSKRPTLEELSGTQSISMTIDKFSHLNLMELDMANFEYIVIDESHLLFTSSYRDVMSPTIQRIANCKAKVILMTGTPTAEVLFFQNINHIIVKKEETRIKEFTTYFCPTENEQLGEMINSMVEDVKNKVKILWPTNRGSTYFEQIIALVNYELTKQGLPELKAFYYKKSNYGDDSMDNINRNKSIGDNDIIGCTTYLSVGIDICDAKKFHIYFDNTIICQDIEQYANRIRSNDLYVKMFLPMNINGNMIDWKEQNTLNLGLQEDEIVFVRDLVKTANDMIERNQDESKYNPFILSLLSANKFLKYDEIDCKYYIDETAYKLQFFEKKYIDWGKQYLVIKEGMRYYGYDVKEVYINDTMPEAKIIDFEDLKKRVRHKRWDEYTQNVRKFLSHINDNNIDIYKEVLRGNIEIFKGNGTNKDGISYEEIRGENQLYVESIEVLEKNTPIVVSLYRFYSIETIKDIYEFCIDKKSNRLNHTKLDRIRKFVNIEYNRKKNKLDFPILKYVQDAQKFAKTHPEISRYDIDMFNAQYAADYANSIEGLVVDDNAYYEEIFELIKELWKVIIIESKANKDGKIRIVPFELTWQRKDVLQDMYGNESTHEFLIQCLEDEMEKKLKEEAEQEVELPDFERKNKLTIDQIKNDIPNIIHDGFNYSKYSEEDGSNERFLRRQENTKNIEPMIKMQNEKNTIFKENDFEDDNEQLKDSLFNKEQLYDYQEDDAIN